MDTSLVARNAGSKVHKVGNPASSDNGGWFGRGGLREKLQWGTTLGGSSPRINMRWTRMLEYLEKAAVIEFERLPKCAMSIKEKFKTCRRICIMTRLCLRPLAVDGFDLSALSERECQCKNSVTCKTEFRSTFQLNILFPMRAGRSKNEETLVWINLLSNIGTFEELLGTPIPCFLLAVLLMVSWFQNLGLVWDLEHFCFV